MNIPLLVFSMAIMIWGLAGLFHRYIMYNFRINNCVHMAARQKRVFERLGFHVDIIDADFAKHRSATAHRWLRVGTKRHKIPWEPVFLLPVSPRWLTKFTNVRRAESDEGGEKDGGK